MQSATTEWSGLLYPAKQKRRRAHRHHPKTRWKLIIAICSKMMLGLMLVGCGSFPKLRMAEQRDPVAALQAGAKGDERLEAYRQLAHIEQIPTEMRAMARKLLMDGATTEYNVLARAAAVAALAEYPEPDVAATLIKASEDRSPVVRVEACNSLKQVLKSNKSAEATSVLSRLATTDTDPDVRIAATEAVVALGDKESTNALIDCLKDEEPAVAHRAAEGLRTLTGASITSSKYQDWSAWADGKEPGKQIENTAQREPFKLLNFWRR